MDDFFEKKDGENLNSQNEENSGEAYKAPEEPEQFGASGYGYPDFEQNNLTPQNRINYSEVLPVKDYKPMSKGLKAFALIMAAVIMLTGASVSEDSDLYGKISEGDVITHINGIEVTSDDIVLDIIEESSAGDKISVTVLTKKGNEVTLDAVLKANVGESSYTTEINSSEGSDNDSSSSSGGTFNFPFGE